MRAMNCIANKAAANHSGKGCPSPQSVVACSKAPTVAASMTESAAAKADADSTKCLALQASQAAGLHRDQPEWDASTCVGEEEAGSHGCNPGGDGVPGACRAARGKVAEGLFRENPDLRHLHSARSLKVLLQQSTSCECRDDAVASSEPMLMVV